MSGSQNPPEPFSCTVEIDFSKPIDTSNVKGKNVIVTGGAKGIGAGCVKALAEAGAYVTILDLNEEKGDALVNELKGKGFHVQFTKADVTSFSSQVAGFKKALSFSPQKSLDIIITSAGITANNIQGWLNATPTSSTDPQPPPTQTLDVNLTGTFYSAHLALHYFRQDPTASSSSKQIVFISSLAGYVPIFQFGDYVASKHGVRGFWKTLRYSNDILRGENGSGPAFRTNLIAPTFIKTDMTADNEGVVTGMGIEFGEVDDVVAGVMRVVCDESASGRAVAIAKSENVAGDRNFDVCDDWEGLDAGPQVLRKIRDGTVRGLELVGRESHRPGAGDALFAAEEK
ncbi:NAD(P)-binding protein [Zopfia rhizophila CBS 207.26]|uniref:NAD(P)-binding protein n=1 Tax=Zopfia rhizophila CBS 207.26 TaxID=1314779 RepID=A0A6A6EW96_9PEZI|nr:NAD(P)-binding protein [Zopfia rhizophila CBS 207.26]